MANATASDVSIDDLLLNGGTAPSWFIDAITDTSLTQQISGASNIVFTLSDPDRTILRSALFVGRTTIGLDDLTFEYAAAGKTGESLSFTVEDRAVSVLRRHKNVVKAAAGTTSRVAFCRRLIAKDAPWIVVDGPTSGPTILTEISTGQTTRTSTVSALNDTTSTATTISAQSVAQYAYAAGFRGNALLEAVAIAHAESGFNPTEVDHDSNGTQDWGLWQINSVHGYSKAQMFDASKNAAAAFRISNRGSDFGPWSTYAKSAAHPLNNGAYRQYMAAAQTTVTNFLGNNATTIGTDGTQSKQSNKPEDHWAAVGRIMGEIGWRVFARRGHIVIAPDRWLLAQDGITITETDEGIDSIDFDVDRGKKVSTVTVTCRADRWKVLPGEPVTVADMGPADDTWLTSQIVRSLTSSSATVTLVKKQKTLPEPTGQGDGGSGGINGAKVAPVTLANTSADVRKMVTWALATANNPAISYVFATEGPDSYDCSGFVQTATAKGGHEIGARTAETQYELCLKLGLTITVESALKVCGALLFQPGDDPKGTYGIGHVAISLGNGHFVAAEDRSLGVGVFKTGPASAWSHAALAPGFNY